MIETSNRIENNFERIDFLKNKLLPPLGDKMILNRLIILYFGKIGDGS